MDLSALCHRNANETVGEAQTSLQDTHSKAFLRLNSSHITWPSGFLLAHPTILPFNNCWARLHCSNTYPGASGSLVWISKSIKGSLSFRGKSSAGLGHQRGLRPNPHLLTSYPVMLTTLGSLIFLLCKMSPVVPNSELLSRLEELMKNHSSREPGYPKTSFLTVA